MEQSEKEEFLKEIRIVVHQEVGPVLDILMEYMEVRFDEADERFLFAFGRVGELLQKLVNALDP